MKYFLFLILVQVFTAFYVSGFTVKSLIGEAQVSHSGPTNALYGHERFFDEPHDENDRVKRGIYYKQFNNYNRNWNRNWNNNWNNNRNNNQWPDLRVSSEPPNEYLKMWITSEHNKYRQLVPATNMRMLYWSEELAASAQRHADRCDFRHSRDRVNVGENIWAAPYANYSDAITRWFQEVNDPRCGCNHAYKHCCGHYIQVVWAQTNLVGCGFARCQGIWGLGGGHRNVFVCHYNPQGNTVFVNGNGQLYAVPAFKWATNNNDRCSECPSDAPACYQGLCYKPTESEKTTHSSAEGATPGNEASTTSPENNHNQQQSSSRRSFWDYNRRSYYKQTYKESQSSDDVRR